MSLGVVSSPLGVGAALVPIPLSLAASRLVFVLAVAGSTAAFATFLVLVPFPVAFFVSPFPFGPSKGIASFLAVAPGDAVLASVPVSAVSLDVAHEALTNVIGPSSPVPHVAIGNGSRRTRQTPQNLLVAHFAHLVRLQPLVVETPVRVETHLDLAVLETLHNAILVQKLFVLGHLYHIIHTKTKVDLERFFLFAVLGRFESLFFRRVENDIANRLHSCIDGWLVFLSFLQSIESKILHL